MQLDFSLQSTIAVVLWYGDSVEATMLKPLAEGDSLGKVQLNGKSAKAS